MKDKNGEEITEERIREEVSKLDWPGVIDHGNGMYTIKGGSSKKGERSINTYANKAGVEMFQKAFMDLLKKEIENDK